MQNKRKKHLSGHPSFYQLFKFALQKRKKKNQKSKDTIITPELHQTILER